ncbi:response regulator [Amycolatopsis sp. SID8362]|nr:response regulator [Amycolatopsis sp. SID8362]NED42786.1 response regulator transcription factor [Amycolatopsis sp. SID8362]
MQTSDEHVRVVVADDHPMFRSGVTRCLQASGYISVVGQAGDGREALEMIRNLSPDVAVLDLKMPELDGAEVCHAVVRDALPTRVLFVSAYTESSVLYRMLQLGAVGCLPKEARRAEIVDAVRACGRGEGALAPALTARLAGEIRLRARTEGPALTDRETEVLRLIAEGRTVPQMARDLFLAEATIKTHIRRLYDKLEVSDRGAVVAKAMRHKLIE